jgi:hypothetical protein
MPMISFLRSNPQAGLRRKVGSARPARPLVFVDRA